jgi:hypothetical protein
MSFAIWWSRNKAPSLWLVLIVAVAGVISGSIQDTFTPALAFLRVTLACVAVCDDRQTVLPLQTTAETGYSEVFRQSAGVSAN